MSGTIKKIYDTVTNALDINQVKNHYKSIFFKSILSGCIDIIVVEQADGSLQSTPFHLRFGKFKALRGSGKNIDIFINGEKKPLSMQVGKAGEGYFNLSEFKDESQYQSDEAPSSEFDAQSMSEDDFQNYQNIDKHQIEQVQELLDIKQNKWNWIWGSFPQKDIAPKVSKNPNKMRELEEMTNQIEQQETDNPQAKGTMLSQFMGIFKGKKDETVKDKQIQSGSPPEILSPKSEQQQKEFIAQKEDTIIEISLCKHLIQPNFTPEQKEQVFEQNKINYEQFENDPQKIIQNNNLMFRIGDYSYGKEDGLAILLSKVIYKKDLILPTKQEEKQSIWFRWFRSKKTNLNQTTPQKNVNPVKEENPVQDSMYKKNRKLSEEVQYDKQPFTLPPRQKKIKKSMRPTSEMLRKLNLNYGVNTITYKINTELQGEKELTGNIFLFKHDIKLVISDIDGTITKSDVFGQLMPMMGTEWSHPGVASLYQNIHKNGYQLIYLTARAIGQSDKTKVFIKTMSQGQVTLPLGPVIMSPDRLLPSFKREVIDKKPEVFKIKALKDIRNLFDSDTCMYAGFGNRESDAISYQTVGIDLNRIFIIDTESNIHVYNSQMLTTYKTLNYDVDLYFPDLDGRNAFLGNEEFTNYWSIPLDVDLSTNIDDLLA